MNMKPISRILVALFLVFWAATAFRQPVPPQQDTLKGAWRMENNGYEVVLLMMDGYLTGTTYSLAAKQFVSTSGGPYKMSGNQVSVTYEFDTENKEQVGQTISYTVMQKGAQLTVNVNGTDYTFSRIDEGKDGLSGLWSITARKQGNDVVPIHQTGTRKTIKILTGTRFQWAAIDPGTKSFMGTGGGSYAFKDGKYTENIEFFSRDSSRVGGSLSFDGKLVNGEWHHSGLSSRGEPIYEVWSRKEQKP